MTERTLSFNLKSEETEKTGNVDVQISSESKGQATIPVDQKMYWILMGLVFACGILVGFVLFINKDNTLHILLGCVSIMVSFILVFGIYCWYRVCMTRLSTDERKMGYKVLKESVGRLSESHEIHMIAARSYDCVQNIVQALSTKKVNEQK